MEAAKRKLLTLAFVLDRSVRPNRILLGRKKTGFGAGYYNGFGGKVEVGETVVEAAKRELKEEATIDVGELTHTGVIHFDFYDPPLVPMQVHVFVATEYDGTPAETSEMAPQWFPVDRVPFNKMWQDDPLWFPHMISGRPFIAKFLFRDTHTMETTDVKSVPTAASLPEMPPVGAVTHSRHQPPRSAEEAAAMGKWYEQSSPDTSDGATAAASDAASNANTSDDAVAAASAGGGGGDSSNDAAAETVAGGGGAADDTPAAAGGDDAAN